MLKRNLVCGCGLIVMLLLAAGSGDSGSSTATGGTSSPSGSFAKESVRSQLKLNFTWSKAGFENVMEANFVIKNDSDQAVKDLEITCNHFANSGTLIDKNVRTIYEIVGAHKTKRIPSFNMGFIHSQARKSSCNISDFEIVP